jgi:hypothetical protein
MLRRTTKSRSRADISERVIAFLLSSRRYGLLITDILGKTKNLFICPPVTRMPVAKADSQHKNLEFEIKYNAILLTGHTISPDLWLFSS